MSNTRLTLLVAGLIVIGFVVGTGIGASGEPTAKTITVARTVATTKTMTQTVTTTQIRVRYRTRVKYRTVTETAPESLEVAATDDSADTGNGGCSPEYSGACVPDDAGDVNCGDLIETDFESVSSDPYGLDRDGDGVACES